MLSAKARPIDHEKVASLANDMPHYRTKVLLTRSCARKVWDNYQIICEVRKTDKLKFVLAGATREGWRCLIIREFYLRKEDGTWQPGRNGITIPIKSPLFEKQADGIPGFIEPLYDMLRLLPDAVKHLEDMELCSREHEIWLLPKVRAKETDDEDQ